MKLFEKTEDKIQIYQFIPNTERVMDFKRRELSTINLGERIFKAITNSPSQALTLKPNERIQNLAHKSEALRGEVYHYLKESDLSKEEQDRILYEYINNERYADSLMPISIFPAYEDLEEDQKQTIDCLDELSDKDMQIIRNVKYYIHTQHYYQQNSEGIYCCEGIINLPESLYVYERLQKGYFLIAEGYDITDQLKLFDGSLTPHDTLEISSCKDLDSRLGTNYYANVEEQVKESQKVLSLIKKMYEK